MIENIELDRDFLRELGVHEINIEHFIRGSYLDRAKYLGRHSTGNFWWFIVLILIIAGSIFSLIEALNGWIYS